MIILKKYLANPKLSLHLKIHLCFTSLQLPLSIKNLSYLKIINAQEVPIFLERKNRNFTTIHHLHSHFLANGKQGLHSTQSS